MNAPIDTSTLIFFLEDGPRLPSSAAERIEAPDSRSSVSLASLGEIAIKVTLGKLPVDDADHAEFPEMLSRNGASKLFHQAGIRCAGHRFYSNIIEIPLIDYSLQNASCGDCP